ncbi:XdhC family protein [Halobacterium jilantaiense]|uniref:Xanthine dehydrogenase accessory factor n=1 Tax=Halobacterium jilantaiense TaxID=355548 RepID=A0A1I0QWG2_9EURY|nr:XdhC/CoxI family protein [Halobacterium jilantaiense]SEW31340.1 xanthine dehydrogenase accessory factor [Halobacterium jilantaiense]
MDRDDPWSVTDRSIHDTLAALRDEEANAAVATVVDVEGSAYRRPGAKLLAPADGDALGAVTAGCLDGPVNSLAADVRDSGTATVETFDLTDGEEWGLGLGCNGIIDLLVDPLDDSYDPLLDALADHEAATALTVVRSADPEVPVGSRTTVTADGDASGSDRPGVPEDALDSLRAAAEDAMAEGTSGVVTVEREAGVLDVFVDGVEPAPELLLFGSQNDAKTVAKFGAAAGFRVTVASSRGARADGEQFPDAHRVVATHPTEVAEHVQAPERTYAVLMSHNLVDDRLALEALLRDTAVPYVGLMGPRERFDELRDALAGDDVALTQSELDRVSTPVGLDLGDGSPTGIALSIVAEATAVANDAAGGRLREQSGHIHPRVDPST